MSTTPQAGWHRCPKLPGTLRWWDGSRWTDHTRPLPGAASPATAPDLSAGFVDYDAPAATPDFAGPSSAPVGRPTSFAPAASLLERSRFTMATIFVVVLYVIIAKTAGLVLIGFVPLGCALRAWRAREPLAPLALAAAAFGLVFSLVLMR